MQVVCSSTIPNINNYQEALAQYEKMAGRNQSERAPNEHPLDNGWVAHKQHYGIHKGRLGREYRSVCDEWENANDISFRYHDTHCVTYHENGFISINGYSSMSTDTFVDQLTPSSMWPRFNGSDGELLFVERFDETRPYRWEKKSHGYLMPNNRCAFRPGVEGEDETRWVPVTPTDPHYVYKTDRKKARQVLKETGFYDLAAWLPAYLSFKNLIGVTRCPYKPSEQRSAETTLDILLADRSKWPLFVQRREWWIGESRKHWGRITPAGFKWRLLLDNLRHRLLANHGCIELTELPYVVGIEGWENVKKNNKKYA